MLDNEETPRALQADRTSEQKAPTEKKAPTSRDLAFMLTEGTYRRAQQMINQFRHDASSPRGR